MSFHKAGMRSVSSRAVGAMRVAWEVALSPLRAPCCRSHVPVLMHKDDQEVGSKRHHLQGRTASLLGR